MSGRAFKNSRLSGKPQFSTQVCSNPGIGFYAIYTIEHPPEEEQISLSAAVQNFASDCLIWRHILISRHPTKRQQTVYICIDGLDTLVV